MSQDISVHGDRLERRYAPFILARLPFYPILWSSFVGSDGEGGLAQRNDLPASLNADRSLLSQFSYNAVLSAILAMRDLSILENLCRRSLESGVILDIHLEILTRVLSFYTQLGRVREMIQRLGKAIGDGALATNLREVWTKRCNVLHGVSPLFHYGEDRVEIVCPEGVTPDPLAWSSEKTWSESATYRYEEVAPLLQSAFDEMVAALNHAFGRAYSKLLDSPMKAVHEALADVPISYEFWPTLSWSAPLFFGEEP